MNSNRLTKALSRVIKKVRDERVYGTLGRVNADGTVTVVCESRPANVWIRLDGGTIIDLPNTGKGRVPVRANLPVQMIRLHNGDLALDGQVDTLLEGDTGAPDEYGVLPHPFTAHTDVPATYTGAGGFVLRVNAAGTGVEFVAAYTHPNHTGDVTSVGDGATVIAADAVTNAKLANMAANTVKGRITAGTGDPEDLTATQVRTIINVADGATAYTDEMARDALGVALVAGANVTVTVDDALDTITIAATGGGGYTDEQAQDAVGAMLVDTATIDLAYVDATPALTATVIDASITNAKLADMAQNTVKGRITASTGAPEDLTATQLRTIANVEDGADVTDAGNIASSITGAATDDTIVDADVWGYLTSGVLVKTAWSNIKSTLQTHFDTLYVLLAGKAGGQTVNGGTAANEDLTLEGTAHATKTTSYVLLQPTSGHVGIGTTTPGVDIVGTLDLDSPTYTLLQIDGAAARLIVRGSTNAGFALIDTTAAANAKWMQFSSNAGAGTLDSIKDDGTAQVANIIAMDLLTGNVGIGVAAPAGKLGVQAGTSSNDAAVGGVLYVATTQVGNTTTGITVLHSYTVPANTLAVNGQSLWFEAWGTFAANANNKNIFVYLNGVAIFNAGNIASNNVAWHIRGRIVRTGAATQKGFVTIIRGVNPGSSSFAPTATLSNANALDIRGQATATNDILIQSFIVGFDDNNT